MLAAVDASRSATEFGKNLPGQSFDGVAGLRVVRTQLPEHPLGQGHSLASIELDRLIQTNAEPTTTSGYSQSIPLRVEKS